MNTSEEPTKNTNRLKNNRSTKALKPNYYKQNKINQAREEGGSKNYGDSHDLTMNVDQTASPELMKSRLIPKDHGL